MSTVEERFQAMLAKRKKNKEEDEKKLVKSVSKNVAKKKTVGIEDVLKIDKDIFGNLTEDVNLLEYLEKKSIEILTIQSKNLIELGRNLTEVFEELSRQGSPEGLYLKYLEVNGYKKDTALRLRKRYELYTSTKDERLKKVISILSIRNIEQMYRNKDELLKQIEDNSDINYKSVMEKIEGSKEKVIEMINHNSEASEYDIGNIDILYQKINTNFDKLDTKKKDRLRKLLLEIERILG